MNYDEDTKILITGGKDKSIKVIFKYLILSFGNFQIDGQVKKLRNLKKMK
jgi:hypothetical protein